MRGKARYIDLDEDSRRALEVGHHSGKQASFRKRCQIVLLSDKGYSIDQIADIQGCVRQTVTTWFDRFEDQGINGLQTAKGRGRPAIIRHDNKDHIDAIEEIVEKHPQKLSEALEKIKEVTGKKMSKRTLGRLLKKTAGPGNASAADLPSGRQIKK